LIGRILPLETSKGNGNCNVPFEFLKKKNKKNKEEEKVAPFYLRKLLIQSLPCSNQELKHLTTYQMKQHQRDSIQINKQQQQQRQEEEEEEEEDEQPKTIKKNKGSLRFWLEGMIQACSPGSLPLLSDSSGCIELIIDKVPPDQSRLVRVGAYLSVIGTRKIPASSNTPFIAHTIIDYSDLAASRSVWWHEEIELIFGEELLAKKRRFRQEKEKESRVKKELADLLQGERDLPSHQLIQTETLESWRGTGSTRL